MSKKKIISHQISDQSYARKKICISTNQCPKQRKQKSRQKMPKPNQSVIWDFRFNRRSPSQEKKKKKKRKSQDTCVTQRILILA